MIYISPTTLRSYCCDSISFPTLLWLCPLPTPMVGAVVETSSISALQRGHSAFILSHLSTQPLWKKCPQGSIRRSSLSTYLAKQIQQTCQPKGTDKFYISRRRKYGCQVNNVRRKSHSIFTRNSPCLVCSSSQDSTATIISLSTVSLL
jgi:hypothetical protein